jgi:hypothetical protein
MMITPFSIRDVLTLARLQNQLVSLCPIEALSQPRLPIWTALASLLPIGEARSSTFVLNERRAGGDRIQGFIQAEQFHTRPELHIRYIAPRLDGKLDTWEDARTAWVRLVNHIASVAGQRGLQRIYATVPEGGEALQILLGLGFSVYTREEIFCLAPDAHPQAVAQEGIRPEQSTDAWNIGQLYRQTTPHLVLQAEAPSDRVGLQTICGPIAWERGEGFVLQDQTGIAGYGHLLPGRTGHWLTVIVHPRAYDRAETLFDYGLALLNYYPPYPVYCLVREYQGGIRAPLQDRGFTPLSVHCRMVRHTTVRVVEPARTFVPALEQRREATTPTASHSERS